MQKQQVTRNIRNSVQLQSKPITHSSLHLDFGSIVASGGDAAAMMEDAFAVKMQSMSTMRGAEAAAVIYIQEQNMVTCLYYNLACCYHRLGLFEESIEYLELASSSL